MSASGPAEPSLPEKVIAVHDRLSAAKIPHALGGAMALAYYGEPRATIDIDLNVFVPANRWQEVIDLLAPLGIETTDLDPKALEREGQCRLWWEDNPVDLFFAYAEIHEEMRKRVRRVPFSSETLPILAPEHLAVCKAMLDRPKDWIDIEQILVATDELDIDQIEGWLERIVGARDQRLLRFEQLKETLEID